MARGNDFAEDMNPIGNNADVLSAPDIDGQGETYIVPIEHGKCSPQGSFQSALDDGQPGKRALSLDFSFCRAQEYGFNPPPTSLPGETCNGRSPSNLNYAQFCFPIHSRHRWPGETNEPCCTRSLTHMAFQSAPDIAAGGNIAAGAAELRPPARCFNPPPTSMARGNPTSATEREPEDPGCIEGFQSAPTSMLGETSTRLE